MYGVRGQRREGTASHLWLTDFPDPVLMVILYVVLLFKMKHKIDGCFGLLSQFVPSYGEISC